MNRLTLEEVAARLRCGHSTAGKLLRTGQIEASKVAGKWLATESAVDAYVAAKSNRARKRRARAA